jgi:endonuclease G
MFVDRMTMAYARRALREAAQTFLYTPNIDLIDFGHPERNGQLDESDLAIRIHVHQKLADVQLESALMTGTTRPIPPSIGGFPTDIPEGRFGIHQWGWGGWGNPTQTNPYAVRTDPLCGGLSISDERHNGYGTLGGLVVDRATGAEMILSNWHVLAADWIARTGQRIYQPGRLDGGSFQDTIATLTRHAMSVNLDAAVATLNGSRRFVNKQLDLGPVTGVGRAELGMEVVKSGRRSGITHGRVIGVEGIAKLTYSELRRTIRNVITIAPRLSFDEVSGPGDSGSWWLDQKTMRVVGLHFAGSNSPERGLGLDMISVLEALQVDIITDVQRSNLTQPQHAMPTRA